MENKKQFIIPVCRFSVFEKKMNSLSNKAKKLTPDNIISFEVVGQIDKKFFPNPPADLSGIAAWSWQKDNAFMLPCNIVEVQGLAPVLNNNTFVGTIQHKEEGNIIRLSPMIPEDFSTEKYREVQTNCDHCKVKRYRKDTYLVMNVETNEVLQVGRSCLKDFMGHKSPEHYANLCSSLLAIREEFEGSSFSFGYEVRSHPITEVLAYASMIIKSSGYTSRSSCRDEGGFQMTMATADYVQAYFDGSDSKGVVSFPSKEDQELAKTVRDFILEIDKKEEKSDFEHNLVTMAKCNHILLKDFGITVYMVQHLLKHLQRIEDKKNELPSSHFGEVKERYNLSLIFRRQFDFGTCEFSGATITLYSFNDAKGNIFCWKTTNGFDFEQGCEVFMKGTIKNHTTWGNDNIEQTFLTRCKLYEEAEFKAIVEKEEAKAARKIAREIKKAEKAKAV